MIERGERLTRVVGVGVRHGRVLTHHIHATNATIFDGMHDLDYRQTGFSIERARGHLPRGLKARTRLGVGDVLIVGIHHRNQTGVRCPLNVVLTAQRVQSGAGTADLAGHQRECDQAARVVGAVNVLRHAHAP